MTKLTPAQIEEVKIVIANAIRSFEEKIVKPLESKLSEIEAKLATKENEIKQRNELIKSLQAATAQSTPPINVWFKETKAEVHFLAKMRQEATERERIKKNVIISGLPETGGTESEKESNDLAKVDSLLNVLGLSRSTVSRQVRLKVHNPNAKLVLVEFNDVSLKEAALSRAGKLRNEPAFNRIFLNRDMTKAERVAEKELRDEPNKLNKALPDKDSEGRPCGKFNGKPFHWGVRSGELRRIFDRTTA